MGRFRKCYSLEYIIVSILVSATAVAGAFLSSAKVSADDSVVEQVSVTIPISCSLIGTGTDSHTAEITNGHQHVGG